MRPINVRIPDLDPYKIRMYDPRMEKWKKNVVKNGVCVSCANGGLGCRHICYGKINCQIKRKEYSKDLRS